MLTAALVFVGSLLIQTNKSNSSPRNVMLTLVAEVSTRF